MNSRPQIISLDAGTQSVMFKLQFFHSLEECALNSFSVIVKNVASETNLIKKIKLEHEVCIFTTFEQFEFDCFFPAIFKSKLAFLSYLRL